MKMRYQTSRKLEEKKTTMETNLRRAVELVGIDELGLYKPNTKGVARIIHPPTTLTETNIEISSPPAENAGFIFKKNKTQPHKFINQRMINPLLPNKWPVFQKINPFIN